MSSHFPSKWKRAREIHSSLRAKVLIALRDGSVIAKAQKIVINGQDLNVRSSAKITVPEQFGEFASSDFDFRIDWIHQSASVSPPASFNYRKKQTWLVEGLEFKTHDGEPAAVLGQNSLSKPAVTREELLKWLCSFSDELRRPVHEWLNEAKKSFPLHRVARNTVRAALTDCGKTGRKGRPPRNSSRNKTAN
ncbi:hypothetical protein [Sphingorhabdus sp.]|uniref:hypothetical protein n=1 Tax=Sphingorhabdus sp. TaxID=1902408 RepID=UPI00404824BC